jgi:hypothetical protein
MNHPTSEECTCPYCSYRTKEKCAFTTYLKEHPGEYAYRNYQSSNNPRLYYADNTELFYQETETEAYLFITRREEFEAAMYIIVHLTLDVENKQVYIDDVYSELYHYRKHEDDSLLQSYGPFVVENKLIDMESLPYIVSNFLGNFKVFNTEEYLQNITGDEWDKYYTYLSQ